MVPVTGGEVFVRHTPWTGPVDAVDGAASDSPSSGAPHERALYVHGLGGASTNWTDLAALLAVRFDGWALDLPGFGRSAPTPRGWSMRHHVQAVVDVLEWIVARPGPAQHTNHATNERPDLSAGPLCRRGCRVPAAGATRADTDEPLA